ncbi:hypothetical protein MMC06_006007 [Schaereria dolodes]|nr:hypothetical protein [Schaereria dolodes]
MSLAILPNEILSSIFSLLPQDSDLNHIALVSHRLRDLVEPFIYERVTLSLCLRARDWHYVLSESARVSRFLQNLRLYPRLGRHVHILNLEVCPHRAVYLHDHKELLSLLVELKELHLYDSPTCLKNVTIPRLEHLGVSIAENAEAGPFRCPDSDEVNVNLLELVADHFWIPSLRYLRIHDILFQPEELNQPFPERSYRTSPIVELCITEFDTEDMRALPNILLSIKTLKKFSLETKSMRHLESDDLSIFLSTHLPALQAHADTMNELIISCNICPSDRATVPMNSFASFRSLKKLGIPEIFLTSHSNTSTTLHERLPPSLEVLQLQYSPLFSARFTGREMRHRHKSLKKLAANKSTFLPALKRIIYWDHKGQTERMFFRSSEAYAWAMDPIVRMFEEVGVKFECVFAYRLEETPLVRDDDILEIQ